MKRIIGLLLPLLVFVSCAAYAGNDRLQRRASRFAQTESKRVICNPDSYEEMDIQVDSAFVSCFNDPVILAEAAKIVELQRGGRPLSSSLQSRVERHKEAIKARISTLNEGEFFGWEIRNRFRSKNNIGHMDISEHIIIADKSFDNTLFIADFCGEDVGSYCDLVECIDGIVAQMEFKAAVNKVYHDVSQAAADAFDKISVGAEAAAKVVKKEGKVIYKEVKERGSEIVKDISSGVEDFVERVSEEK